VAQWAQVAGSTGLAEEADAAADWLVSILDGDEALSDVVGLDANPPQSERELPLAGWRKSQPVRVGYDPPEHPSVETACALLAATAALADQPAGAALIDRWDRLVAITDGVAAHWADGDEPVSRALLARHALAAMAGLAWRRNPLDLDAAGWHHQRMAAEAALLAHAARHRGALDGGRDAGALRAAWYGPWPEHDPVVSATMTASQSRLSAGGWLLARAPEVDSGRAASVVATLWRVRALALTGQWEEANLAMEHVAAVAGPLGLLPEFVDPTTGQPRGNRPFAPAHVAFVEAALALAAGRD
jgi:GH15 family glucan-1,4-alpha-glucosidase